jgi:hypothetical protein
VWLWAEERHREEIERGIFQIFNGYLNISWYESVHLKRIFKFTVRMYGYLDYLFQSKEWVLIEFTDLGDI